MKFDSKTIKAAWQIRKNAAVKFSCRISEIIWSECLKMAKNAVKAVSPIVSKLESLAVRIVTGQIRPTSWERSFILDNMDRADRFGSKTRFSEKQIAVIEKIAVKYF